MEMASLTEKLWEKQAQLGIPTSDYRLPTYDVA
jgi:hypothetical protein